MKLINDTNWDTRQFKSFIRAVAEKVLVSESIPSLVVTLKYRRRSNRWSDSHVKGWGRYNCWKFRLECVKDAALDKLELARTIAIMLSYNQGVHARAVRHNASIYGADWRERWVWAKELPLEMHKDEPMEKPGKPYKLAKKMEHCLQQIVEWEKRSKLADTKLKTWRKKLRYYELTPTKQAPANQVQVDTQTAGYVDVIMKSDK